MDVNKHVLESFLDEINLIKEAVSPKWVSDTVANAVHDVPRHKLIEFADRMASKGHQAFRAANKTRAAGSVSSTKRLEKNQIKYLAAHFKAGDKLEKRAVSGPFITKAVSNAVGKVSPERATQFSRNMFNRATNLGNKARLSGQLGDVRQANKYNRLGDLAGRAWQGADTYAGKTW